MLKKAKKIKDEDLIKEEMEEVLPHKYVITSYGADYTVDGVVKRMKEESIVIPSFQRAFVWNRRQSSRFIESLLLGLPVPGIFLSKDPSNQKLIVIDGQQRLKTLQYFYEGKFRKDKGVFVLESVQKEFEGKGYETLTEGDKRKLDDSIIHATIIKQDTPTEDDSSVYFIFERLNTGGLVLQPQEIRACIYDGAFNNLLKKLNENKDWRSLYGPASIRMRDHEIILRFFALYFGWENYSSPMKGFLNDFMKKNRYLDTARFSETKLEKMFCDVVSATRKAMGKTAFKPKGKFLAALADSLMIGVAKKLEKGNAINTKSFISCYRKLLADDEFMEMITTHTSDENNVKYRIKTAINIFKNA